MLNPPNFAVVRKGFDQAQVMGYLRSVERSLQMLVEEKADLSRRIVELEERVENPDLDIEKITELVGRQASEILRGAHDAAEAIRQRADAVSKETVARAAREAAEIVSRANLDAEAQLDEATGTSQEILEAARSQAHDTIVVAEQGAASILDRAKVEGRAVILRARELRSKIFGETQARIDELQLEIQGLEDSRTVLIQLIRSARRMVDEMAEVLEGDVVEPGDPVSADDDSTAPPIDDERKRDVANTEGERDESLGSFPSAREILIDVVEESVGERFESDESPSSSGFELQSEDVADDVEESVVDSVTFDGPQSSDAEVDLLVQVSIDLEEENALTFAPEALRADVEPQASESIVGVDTSVVSTMEAPSEVGNALQSFLSQRIAQRVSTVIDSDNESVEVDEVRQDPSLAVSSDENDAPDLGAANRLAPSDHRLHRLEDLFDRLKVTQVPTADQEGRVAMSEAHTAEASGSHETSHRQTLGDMRPREVVPRVDSRAVEDPHRVDRGLAEGEIRSALDEADRALTPTDSETGGTARGDDALTVRSDNGLLEARDLVVGPIATSLGRRIKRMLQDDQNDLLDALRQGGIARVLERTAELSSDSDRRAQQVFELLHKSEREGFRFAEELRGGPKSQDPGQGANSSERELRAMTDHSLQVVTSLTLGRVASMSSALEGANEAGQVSILGSIFRDIRGQKVDELVGDLVSSAFALGVRSLPGALGYRWLTSDLGVNCADCDDNALANVNPSEEDFPTGHRLPPVHGGCRCLIVPVFA
ncbi:MAG: DivIVA domain-containing protein [Acidimicrobiales bacterium]